LTKETIGQLLLMNSRSYGIVSDSRAVLRANNGYSRVQSPDVEILVVSLFTVCL